MKRCIRWLAAAAFATLMLACQLEAPMAEMETVATFKAVAGTIGVNVLLNTAPIDAILKDLAAHGKVRDVVPAINAVTLQAKSSELAAIRTQPHVEAASPDHERKGGPVSTQEVADFSDASQRGTYLDAINVTDLNGGRVVEYDGDGVYVAVLDTGLLNDWRYYFPNDRIATECAACFGGGGGEVGTVSRQPNKRGQDTNSHGTHVASTILGYRLRGVAVNGVAPLAKVIPGKVLNQNGSGWSSVIARGIVYLANLKAGPLADCPVVINMSLGGPDLEPMEAAAIDYAIGKGVVLVASAGNEGEEGMGYPGAYEPVISVAASGWVGEWTGGRTWWNANDVPDPTDPADFTITDFSSRALPGQHLDVAAPGSWVVGPYQVNSGQTSYYFIRGTSMASPHVAGIVALMLEKNPALTAALAESILETQAISLAPGERTITNSNGTTTLMSWGADATGAGLVTADAALAGVP